MKFPTSFSYFAGPILGYSAKFSFKRAASPFSVYFHCDNELVVRVSAFSSVISFDVFERVEQKKRDDVYFD